MLKLRLYSFDKTCNATMDAFSVPWLHPRENALITKSRLNALRDLFVSATHVVLDLRLMHGDDGPTIEIWTGGSPFAKKSTTLPDGRWTWSFKGQGREGDDVWTEEFAPFVKPQGGENGWSYTVELVATVRNGEGMVEVVRHEDKVNSPRTVLGLAGIQELAATIHVALAIQADVSPVLWQAVCDLRSAVAQHLGGVMNPELLRQPGTGETAKPCTFDGLTAEQREEAYSNLDELLTEHGLSTDPGVSA